MDDLSPQMLEKAKSYYADERFDEANDVLVKMKQNYPKGYGKEAQALHGKIAGIFDTTVDNIFKRNGSLVSDTDWKAQQQEAKTKGGTLQPQPQNKLKTLLGALINPQDPKSFQTVTGIATDLGEKNEAIQQLAQAHPSIKKDVKTLQTTLVNAPEKYKQVLKQMVQNKSDEVEN